MLDFNNNYELNLKVINACLMVERFYTDEFRGHVLALKDTPIETLENIFKNRIKRLSEMTQDFYNEIPEEIKEPKVKRTTKKATTKKQEGNNE